MCRVFSCIIDRAGKVYSQKDNPSHTVIAEENNLPEDGVSELNRAKVEVVPEAGYSYKDEPTFDSWRVEVDERCIPDWFNDRHYRSAMAAANKWWHSRIIKHGETRTVSEGLWMVLDGSPVIVADFEATVKTHGNSTPTITASGDVCVFTHENSAPVITAGGDAAVWITNKSSPRVTLHDAACADVYDESSPTIKANDNSTVSLSSFKEAHIEATNRVCFYGSKYNCDRASITII